ncbi:neuronal acetylcholine receptor subunit alpha-10-like [Amphiura filiformis]|uniref:neuronal acetylcholine receptor subunit alpha-10-like n=1 Tax=Amphiura filiformis TaxID=82378 RepID=UPI003B21FF4F
MMIKRCHLDILILMLLVLCTGCSSQKQTVAVKMLHHRLFDDYSNEFRPTHNSSTATKVIFRMIFRNLLDMNTREQRVAVGGWLKLTWTDEFLTWNPDDFDGLQRHTVPVSKIWSPDITLYDNADLSFERYKADTVAQLYPDGTVIWYVPAIYTSTCIVRVRWFPFDVQVCEMIFGSWGYNGFEIDLYQETSLDASTMRYLANGVWDMVAVRAKRLVVTYLCCPEPYPEIHYLLVFKRHAAFYIFYMVLPCLFLSILSLLVFYLPPDCGEKLTLSITNLLALVVFQQIIAENMPPSAEESPVIGTYFLCMIVMVCASVITTGIVMHVSALSQPVPRWVKRVFLHFLTRILCLSAGPLEGDIGEPVIPTTIIPNSNARELPIENGNVKGHTNGINKQHTTATTSNTYTASKELEDGLETLRFMKLDLTNKNAHKFEHMQWQRVSIILDRLFLNIFSVFMIVCTIYLAMEIVIGTEEEYDAIKRDLEENWQ